MWLLPLLHSVCPTASVSHWCFLFQGWRAFQCVHLSHFLHASSHQWRLILFSLLWIVLSYNWLCIYLFETISFPLGTYPIMGIARSYANSMVNSLRTCQACFPEWPCYSIFLQATFEGFVCSISWRFYSVCPAVGMAPHSGFTLQFPESWS